MNNSKSNGPWGYGVAPVESKSGKTLWVQVGPVWRTKDGDLQLQLEAEPVAWRDPSVQRTVLIRERNDR